MLDVQQGEMVPAHKYWLHRKNSELNQKVVCLTNRLGPIRSNLR